MTYLLLKITNQSWQAKEWMIFSSKCGPSMHPTLVQKFWKSSLKSSSSRTISLSSSLWNPLSKCILNMPISFYLLSPNCLSSLNYIISTVINLLIFLLLLLTILLIKGNKLLWPKIMNFPIVFMIKFKILKMPIYSGLKTHFNFNRAHINI